MLENNAFFALELLNGVFILLINVKMPTIVGILTFISSINFMLRLAEHKKFNNLRSRCSQLEPCYRDTREYILERNHLNVNIAENASRQNTGGNHINLFICNLHFLRI